MKFVRPNDSSETNIPDPDDVGIVRLRVPTDGGTVEIIYKRGGHEYKETIIIRAPAM